MIRQFIPEEFCLRCQGCCRFHQSDSVWLPSLLEEDKDKLLKNNVPPFFILSNKKIRLIYSQKQDNFFCSLFDADTNKCQAYAFRPFECQLYPFLINRSNKKVFLAVDSKCPFVKEKQESKIFKEYIQYLADFFNRSDILKILKENPQIIQEYPEALDFLVLKI